MKKLGTDINEDKYYSLNTRASMVQILSQNKTLFWSKCELLRQHAERNFARIKMMKIIRPH